MAGKGKGNTFGMRHVQALMASMAVMVIYMLRLNMSVGIVAMTNKTNANPNFTEYKWSEAEKSRILSAFFWGYLTLQILVGNMAEKYGAKAILAIAMTMSSVLTLIIPVLVPYGYTTVLALRVLQGAAQGSFLPCITVLLSKWFSPVERSRAMAIAFSGGKLGTVIGFPVAGYLASSSGGWPSIFYATGGAGLVWVLLWLWLGASSPDCCHHLTEREKMYIEKSVKLSSNQDEKKPQTPWKDIIKSVPLWAILIAHLGHNWGYWLLFTQLPNYMNSVLGVNIKKNGLLSSLPYLSAWSMVIVYSWISVHIYNHYSMSKTVQRKIFNTIGLWGTAIGFLVLGIFDTKNIAVVMTLLMATLAMNSAIFVGFMTNHVDLSPNFCGTLMGITNSMANITSILGPLTVGWIVTDVTSQLEWKYVFLLASGITFAANLIYIVFGSSKVQSWNNPQVCKDYDIDDKTSAMTKDHERQLL